MIIIHIINIIGIIGYIVIKLMGKKVAEIFDYLKLDKKKAFRILYIYVGLCLLLNSFDIINMILKILYILFIIGITIGLVYLNESKEEADYYE